MWLFSAEQSCQSVEITFTEKRQNTLVRSYDTQYQAL